LYLAPELLDTVLESGVFSFIGLKVGAFSSNYTKELVKKPCTDINKRES
jgi:hypothetical protein